MYRTRTDPQTYAVLALVALMLAMVAPVSAHTLTTDYTMTGGVTPGAPAVATRPGGPEWCDVSYTDDEDPIKDAVQDAVTTACETVDPEGDGVVRIGVYPPWLESDHEHRTWLISADDVLGTPLLRVCVAPDGGPCDSSTDHPYIEGCGSVTVSFPEPVPASELRIWMYTVAVTPAGEVCLGSTGVVTVEGSD